LQILQSNKSLFIHSPRFHEASAPRWIDVLHGLSRQQADASLGFRPIRRFVLDGAEEVRSIRPNKVRCIIDAIVTIERFERQLEMGMHTARLAGSLVL